MAEERRAENTKMASTLARLDERSLATHSAIERLDDKFDKQDIKFDKLGGRVGKVEGLQKYYSGGLAVVGAAAITILKKSGVL